MIKVSHESPVLSGNELNRIYKNFINEYYSKKGDA